jgi:hypothetical protein
MNDSVRLDSDVIVEDLLPDNVTVVGRIRGDYLQQLMDVNRLELPEVASNVQFRHEAFYLGIALPEKLI